VGKAAQEKPNFVGFISKHFVALICEYESFNLDGSPLHKGSAVFSGFVIEVNNRWFWVTAGHCLKETLDENIATGVLKVTGGGFMDYFNTDSAHWHQVPFTYEVDCGFYIDDPEMGLDFGLIPLDGNKRQLMEANKVEPISRKNWAFDPGTTFDVYKVLGIPETEVYTADADGEEQIEMRTVLFGVHRKNPDDVPQAKGQDWFVGKIDDAVTVPTVKGMSGGPIFGFRKVQLAGKDRWVYHTIAVQSWWNKDERIIFGCFLPKFAEVLYRGLLAFEAKTN